MTCDIIIVGGGPAGLTAAIYAARNKLKTLVLSRDKGVLSYAHTIENYPGFKSISGLELIEKFEEQAKEFGAEIKEGEVLRIGKENYLFKIETKEQAYEGKTIILALGTEKAKLNIENEDKFIGKGISYCATCDARFFKDKIVGVVGGSNSAAMSALALAEHAKKVFIIYRREEVRAEKILVDRLKEKGVEIIANSVVRKVEGDNVLRKVIIDQNGEEKEMELDGLFIEIGYVPSTTLVQNLGVELDKNFIKVNEKMETNVEGVFAAGDITTGSGGLRQIVTACAEGAIAAISAFKYLKSR
jgi:thioredoxin reductase (NADPH)